MCFVVSAAITAHGATNVAFLSAFRKGWVVEEELNHFQTIGERWKAGATNLPLISIKWFGPSGIVAYSTVSIAGGVVNGSFSEWGDKGWGHGGRENFSGTNLDNLKLLVDRLPPSNAGSNSIARQILVSGLRSNSWFAFIYDRADIPIELERICDLTDARIGWVVPSTDMATTSTNSGGGGRYLQQMLTAKTPVAAVRSMDSNIEVWDLQRGEETRIPSRNGAWYLVWPWPGSKFATNGFSSVGGAIALSPDGKLLVVGGQDSVFALDLPITKPLTPRWLKLLEPSWCGGLAVLDHGKSIAVALVTGVERWSLATGERLSLLSSNAVMSSPERLSVMEASRDGSTLVLQLGDSSLEVWKSPWTNGPSLVLPEREGTAVMAISPNGRYAALRSLGQWEFRLVIQDLETGKRQDMPFRGCYNREASWAAWSPDQKYLAVGSTGQWPCVYDTATWKPILLWRVPANGQYWSGGPEGRLAFTEEGTLLAEFGDGVLRRLKLPVPASALDWEHSDVR